MWSIKTNEEGDIICDLESSELMDDGYATHLAVMESSKSFVAGSSNNHLFHYDYGSSDIKMIRQFVDAHTDDITGVSRDPSNVQQFVSSSKDRSVVMWDLRIPTPDVKSMLYNANGLMFHSVHWCDAEENNGLVMVGARNGFIYSIDVRHPKVFVNKIKAAHIPVTKMAFDG